MNMQVGNGAGCCAAEPQANRESTRNAVVFRPEVDIIETTEGITIYADMPGAEPESISVDFERGTLSLTAKVVDRTRGEGQVRSNQLLREYGVGDFQRVFQVSENIDTTKIEAEYTDGVLVLSLPKVEAAKPRKIQVKTA